MPTNGKMCGVLGQPFHCMQTKLPTQRSLEKVTGAPWGAAWGAPALGG